MPSSATRYLLNLGHAIDHMFLLIFAVAVTSIALDFGIARWEDLMPYSVAAFFFYGVGSLPAGRLGDRWGRRPMMLMFFFGMGASAILVSQTQTPLQLAVALSVLGCFASIYHPVGIPMLVQHASRPGWTIGVNGLCGNLGVALSAIVTGFLIKHDGWRAAFLWPGLICIGCGVLFALSKATAPPPSLASKATAHERHASGISLPKLLLVMTLASTSASLLFNFSTSSNFEMLNDRLRDVSRDPAWIGMLLAGIYTVASLTQLVVGQLIDRYSLKRLYLAMAGMQAVLLAIASQCQGWSFFIMQLLFMAAIFGAIPFTDAMTVRYVDDRIRSSVSGMRLAVSFGASSIAVWLIGPVVKQAGFSALLWLMTCCALCTLLVISQLPERRHSPAHLPEST